MPWYNDLRNTAELNDPSRPDYALVFRNMPDDQKKRAIANLLTLRAGLRTDIPDRIADKNLLLASWNIKEFGDYQHRLPESLFYIAEIINCFDIVAIQELSHTRDMEKVIRLLGNHWKFVINDITEGNAGNKERSGYIFDSRRVQPNGVVGEIVLWEELTANADIKQLKRTPLMTGFRTGWKDFAIINLHLQPGNSTSNRLYRREEVRLLMEAVRAKLDNDHFFTENLIILGDLNLYDNNQTAVDMITNQGFRESAALEEVKTNVTQTESFDRIFYRESWRLALMRRDGAESAGVFDFFQYVFPPNDAAMNIYRPHMLERRPDKNTDELLRDYYVDHWREYQMSDHFPVWLEFSIDSADEFLARRQE